MENNFKGYSMFDDIADVGLRNRNRAVTLANIAESYTNKEKKISQKGAGLILAYFNKVNANDRKDVMERFTSVMKERGFILEGV